MNALLVSCALFGANPHTHIHVIDVDKGQPVSGISLHVANSKEAKPTPENYLGTTGSDGIARGKLKVSPNVRRGRRSSKKWLWVVLGDVSQYSIVRTKKSWISWDTDKELGEGHVVQVRRNQPLAAKRMFQRTTTVCRPCLPLVRQDCRVTSPCFASPRPNCGWIPAPCEGVQRTLPSNCFDYPMPQAVDPCTSIVSESCYPTPYFTTPPVP